MKTFKNCGLALAIAAALTMTTGLTACSSENELTETPSAGQPAQPTATGVKVTVTAGIADDAATRSEVGTENGNRVLKFTAGDRLYVRGFIGGVGAQAEKILSGFVAIDEQSITGTAADFTANYMSDGTGDLKAYVWNADAGSYVATSHDFGEATDILAECQQVVLVLAHSGASFSINSTTQNYYMAGSMVGEIAPTVEELMTTKLTVRGTYDAQNHSVALATVDGDDQCSPIFNCILSGLTAYATYEVDLIQSDGTDETNHPFGSVQADDGGNVSFACYMSGAEKAELTYKLRFTNNDDNTINKYIVLGQRALASKVYNVTRHWTGNCFAKLVSGSVNLASVTDNIVALDGATLSGSLANNVKISIAAGATVTLSGARINDNDAGTGQRWTSGKYAGLTCLGDATIILADGTTNTVRNFGSSYPGIQAAHNTGSDGEYTLTIRGGSLGTGQLITRGHSSGAGIGSAGASDCGNITIEGGTINASSYYAAGIGSGFGFGTADKAATCGNISINGGNVTATGGGDSSRGSAGIGSSSLISRCGNISISGSPTVNATGGNFAAGIGSGGTYQSASLSGTCGTITISLSGGSVTATGGQYAAGIGTGALGTCGSINVERHPGASTWYVTVTADRNNGNAVGGLYDIGKGPNGIIKDGESNGTVNVGSNVRTSNNSQYTGSLSDGYDHN